MLLLYLFRIAQGISVGAFILKKKKKKNGLDKYSQKNIQTR